MVAADQVTDDNGAVLKDWMLRRNCSASPRQFVIFYLSLAAFSLLIALILLCEGVWLVLPFTGIEICAVGIAFVVYARHAVDYEYIRLYEHRLLIEWVSAESVKQVEFNPRWVRVEPGAVGREPIKLFYRGESVEVGRYLALHRRAPFARELRSWLKRCS